jgi:hypothetical protein
MTRAQFEPCTLRTFAKSARVLSEPKLTTVSEGIKYIDLQVPKRAQHHRLVEAAREALYQAEDTGAKSDAAVASSKLTRVLAVVENSRS